MPRKFHREKRTEVYDVVRQYLTLMFDEDSANSHNFIISF